MSLLGVEGVFCRSDFSRDGEAGAQSVYRG